MTDIVERLRGMRGLTVFESFVALKAADEIERLRGELTKIACTVEPHWEGAGLKLEAAWIIKEIAGLGSQIEDLNTEIELHLAELHRLRLHFDVL